MRTPEAASDPEDEQRLGAMLHAQKHRGPDGEGRYFSSSGQALLGHRRLKVLDLTDAGRQPMSSPDGRYVIVFNGEVYNYVELRRDLGPEPFHSGTDTEVVLRAYARWGRSCLDRFLGMFAFAIWDEEEHTLFAARDRFGVKPFHYTVKQGRPGPTLLFASEPKALHAAGAERTPDPVAWATWLVHGISAEGERTFWQGVTALPAGHMLLWCDGALRIERWYDLQARVAQEDTRSETEVLAEYGALLQESVALRFRADVPVGVALSGGLDSSLLLDGVHGVQGQDSDVQAFTFITGDPAYDETPWVREMLDKTRHPSVLCLLAPEDVPALAASVHAAADGPGGGVPTLAYARLFEVARDRGVVVLLDGQGMDEQWAGYDYYSTLGSHDAPPPTVQGTSERPLRPECLDPAFRALAPPPAATPPGPDRLRAVQIRDLTQTKLPRALRYSDRVSMRSSRELREPFLDHRLVELALRQPSERKVTGAARKVLLRRHARERLPRSLREAPKRPLQTPQREWLRGPLRDWARALVLDTALPGLRSWLDAAAVRAELDRYLGGTGDNSYFLWQWIELGLLAESRRHCSATP